MGITKKEVSLIDDWTKVHQEIEIVETNLEILSQKLKKINIRLYAKKNKAELEEFRDHLSEEIQRLNEDSDRDKIKQLINLKSIVEHDINIENLVEQDIDIEEQEINIDLKDY